MVLESVQLVLFVPSLAQLPAKAFVIIHVDNCLLLAVLEIFHSTLVFQGDVMVCMSNVNYIVPEDVDIGRDHIHSTVLPWESVKCAVILLFVFN